MKAKEYVALIRKRTAEGMPEIEVITHFVSELKDETVDLANKRSNNGLVHDRLFQAVLREQDLKYRAVARSMDWNPNGWRDFWSSRGITW